MSDKENVVKTLRIVYIGKHKGVNYNGYAFDKDDPKDVEANIAELLLKSEKEFKLAVEGGD